MKKKNIIIILIIVVLIIIALTLKIRIAVTNDNITVMEGADGPISIAGELEENEQELEDNYQEVEENMSKYVSISMDEARELFKESGDYVIVDVRRADEYASGHIPGAINIANESIGNEMPVELPDLNQKIYVYCRSGNRSKQASDKLVRMGYTNIVEFGGIIDWKGDIE